MFVLQAHIVYERYLNKQILNSTVNGVCLWDNRSHVASVHMAMASKLKRQFEVFQVES